MVQRPQQIPLTAELAYQLQKLASLVNRRRMKAEPQRIAYAVRLQNVPSPLDMESVQPLWQARGQMFLYRASVLVPKGPWTQEKEVVVHHDELFCLNCLFRCSSDVRGR